MNVFFLIGKVYYGKEKDRVWIVNLFDSHVVILDMVNEGDFYVPFQKNRTFYFKDVFYGVSNLVLSGNS